MNKAQKKLEDAEARFTAAWKRRNGEELTSQYDKDMQVELKTFYDNLLSKEAYLTALVNRQQQQGIVLWEANW